MKMDKKLTGQFGTCMSPEQAEIAAAIATLREQFASGTNNVHELIALAEKVKHISRELEVYGFIDDDFDLWEEEENIEGLFAHREELSGYKQLWAMVCDLYVEVLMKLATHEDVLGRRWCAYHDGLEYPAVGVVLEADNDELVQFLVSNARYNVSLEMYIQMFGATKALNILRLMADSSIEGLVVEAVDGLCIWQNHFKTLPQDATLFTDSQRLQQRLTQMTQKT